MSWGVNALSDERDNDNNDDNDNDNNNKMNDVAAIMTKLLRFFRPHLSSSLHSGQFNTRDEIGVRFTAEVRIIQIIFCSLSTSTLFLLFQTGT